MNPSLSPPPETFGHPVWTHQQPAWNVTLLSASQQILDPTSPGQPAAPPTERKPSPPRNSVLTVAVYRPTCGIDTISLGRNGKWMGITFDFWLIDSLPYWLCPHVGSQVRGDTWNITSKFWHMEWTDNSLLCTALENKLWLLLHLKL